MLAKSQTHLLRVLCAASCIVLVAGPVAADDGWNPFRKTDEPPRRGRPAPVEQPPPLAPVDRGVFDGRSEPAERPGTESPGRYDRPWTQAPGTAPGGGGSNTVERVELAPLPPVAGEPSSGPPASVAVPPSGAPPTAVDTMPGLIGRPGGPGMAAGRGPAARSRDQDDPAFWRGLDMASLEKHLGAVEIPLRSRALHGLWQRLMTADAPPPTGVRGPSHFPTLQLEGLYRIGALGPLAARLDSGGSLPNERLAAGFLIRRDLALNDAGAVCERVRALLADRANLPKLLLGEVQILSGYCAAVDGNPKAAGLAASLARDAETDAPLALTLLDAIATSGDGQPPRLELPKRLLLIEYRLLERLGPVDSRRVLPIAEPALLAALAKQADAEPGLRLAATDAAAGIHAVSGADVATIYETITIPQGQANNPLYRRAALYQAIKLEPQVGRRLSLARQILDEARRANLGQPIVAALTTALGRLDVDPGADAGTAVEIAIAADDLALARRAGASPAAGPWLGLAEVADPSSRGLSEEAFVRLEEAASRGRFTPEALHRLATVLDALDVNVPVPLWEAASRTPQPNTGHLPPTGLLPDLDQASRRKERAHTALLALRTIGPGGPGAAHLLALGETIRALRRAGFEVEARQVAVEALLPVWPR